MRVKIIYTNSGRGLHRDAELLGSIFSALGHRVSAQSTDPQSQTFLALERKWYRFVEKFMPPAMREYVLKFQRTLRLTLNGKSAYDLIIHLQSIQLRHLHKNCTQWLIPNQEWFSITQVHYLNVIDSVICKTQEASGLFSRYHPNVRYTGFSSPLLKNPVVLSEKKDFRRPIHVAGNSRSKGTDALISVWLRHPEWPKLTLVWNRLPPEQKLPQNIEVFSNISHDQLRHLWLTAGIAIQPSEVEGFGQILVEAQAFGCVVLTTDAPPMNEVVNSEFGILVPYTSTGAFRMGTRYFVDPNELELAIQKLWRASQEELQIKSSRAHLHAMESYEDFKKHLEEIISEELCSTSTCSISLSG